MTATQKLDCSGDSKKSSGDGLYLAFDLGWGGKGVRPGV